MKNVTIRDVYLAATKAIFQFAVDQGQLADNPAEEVKVRVRKKVKEREKGFEAETILAATLWPFSHLISIEMKAARRWVPWIRAEFEDRLDRSKVSVSDRRSLSPRTTFQSLGAFSA
jgi:hypothetical protein